METDIQPFDWQRIFVGEIDYLYLGEVLFRTGFLYISAVLLLRLIGKRAMGQMTPFEQVVIIALGSAVGDPMFYPSVPLLYSVLIMATIILLNRLLARIVSNNKRIKKFIEGEPVLIIENGKLKTKTLQKENLHKDEIFMKLREQSITDIGQIKKAYLETNSAISVFKFAESKTKKNQSTLP